MPFTGPAVALCVLGGVLLRAWPLLQGQAWLTNVDLYDDGVYQSASLLLARGAWPYRDFAFVHPPGVLLALLPTSLFEPKEAWVAGRWLAVGVGAANLVLVSRVAFRAWGPSAAVVATLAYAVHADALVYERGAFLEGFLNCACLATTLAWLRAGEATRWAFVAGLCGALALSIKVWAVVWLVAAVASAPGYVSLRRGVMFAVTAVVGAALVVLPFVALAPEAFIDDVIRFHLWRPPDGLAGVGARLAALFGRYGGPLALIVAGALASAVTWRSTPPAPHGSRAVAVTFGLLLGALLASRTFWIEYSAHLAAPQSLLAGAAAGRLLSRSWPAALGRWRGAVLLACAGAVLSPLPTALALGRLHYPDVSSLGTHLAEASAGQCVISLEPTWLLAADRLPPLREGVALVDSYGALLIDGMRAGADGKTLDAMHAPAAQRHFREHVEGCWLLPGGRYWQLDRANRDWLELNYVQQWPPPGAPGLQILRPR